MKVIADVEKQTLRMLENERSIFRGEYGVDKLELYINKRLENEYPTITGLLSNGRKIGPYTTDDSYSIETIDGVEYTKASFTLSEKNGFMLSEGKLQITIWMNSDEKKEAIGNVTLNVINTTAFNGGDIIISGDVAGTIVNYRVELENLQSQINTSNVAFNNRITNVEQNKADTQYVDVADEEISRRIDQVEEEKADLSYVDNEITMLINDFADLSVTKVDKQYVDEKFNQILGEGASETLDTISEIAKALEEHNDEYDSLLEVVGNKATKDDLKIKANISYVDQVKEELLDEIDKNTSASKIIFDDGVSLEEKYINGELGTGGGGGGTVDDDIILTTSTPSSIACAKSDTLVFEYNFAREVQTTRMGNERVYVDGVLVSSKSIAQGKHEVTLSNLENGNHTIEIQVTSGSLSSSLVYNVEVVELTINSTFDGFGIYTNPIIYRYTPIGNVEKTMHFVIDEKEYTQIVNESNKAMTYQFETLSHGSHKVKVYATAKIGTKDVTSNVLSYDLVVNNGGTDTIIGCPFSTTKVTQGDLIQFNYVVFTPDSLTSNVSLKINDEEVSNLNVDRTQQTWSLRDYPTGNVVFTIESGNKSVSFAVEVVASDVKIEAITHNLELHLSSVGRSNNENENIRNQWSSNGVVVELNNFNWKSNGWIEDNEGNSVLRVSGDARVTIPFTLFAEDFRSEGKTIEFEFSTHDVRDYDSILIDCLSNGRGFSLTSNIAILYSEQTTIETKFKEDEKVRVSFVIEPTSENRLIYTYVNGVISGLAQYPDDDNFSQSTPVGISIGSSDATIDLYNIRVYDINLDHSDILTNFIADIPDRQTKLTLYNNNDIFDKYGNINYNQVVDRIPCLTFIGDLPATKGDKKIVGIKYVNKFDSSKNFEATGVTLDIQGTSSQYYPRKNYKFNLPNEYKLTNDSIPENVFCLKADYMESSHSHNTGLAKIVNTLYPTTPASQVNEKVQAAITGFPIVVWYRETENSPLKCLGVYNFNNDKDDTTTFGYTSEFPNCESWEFKNNTSAHCLFQNSNFVDTVEVAKNFEARYPDKFTNYTNLSRVVSWVASTNGDLDKFKNEFNNYFNLESTLLYYCLTELFAMVDSRAKNLFLTTWNGNIWYPTFYDMDTAFGLNNEGVNDFNYNVEYHDVQGSQNVFNGESSVLWNNFEQVYADEIQEFYNNLRNNKLVTYDAVMNVLYKQQISKICENNYNYDAVEKYKNPLVEDGIGTYLYIAQGSRLDHLKWWLYNRINYMDSKYVASDYKDNYITLRIYTPETYGSVTPNADAHITPYADQYVTVKYDENMFNERGTHDVETTITAPNQVFNDTPMIIYGASRISDIGDLSPLYAGTVDVSKGIKLKQLIVGNSASDYSNTNLKTLTIGNNELLTKLDVRNCPSLTQTIDASGCTNIEEIYATGTSATAVKVPNGGNLKTLHLPNTITNLTILNQPFITEFVCWDYSKINTLRIENTPINTLTIVQEAINSLERVRLTNINWTLENSSVLEKLMTLKGLNENGGNTDKAVLTGKIHIKGTVPIFLIDECAVIFGTDLTITADIIKNICICEFIDYDGTILETIEVEKGTYATYSGTTPTRPDEDGYYYEFSGWSPSISNVIKINTKFIAQYTKNKYVTVLWLNWDGTELQKNIVKQNQEISFTGTATKPNDAQYKDYVLSGWKDNEGYSYTVGSTIKTTEDITLTAQFTGTLQSYNVYWYNGDTLLATTIVEYGSQAVYTGETPTKDGETSLGWSLTQNSLTVDTDFTIKGETNIYAVYPMKLSLPYPVANANNARVGNNMYLFGGINGTTKYDTILKFDIIGNTITTLNVKLPSTVNEYYNSCGAIENDIYLTKLGQNYDGNAKFNTINETIEILGTLEIQNYNTIISVNDKIYYTTGWSYFYMYDPVSGTKTQLSDGGSLVNCTDLIAHENKIYGTYNNGYNSDLCIFDTETLTFNSLQYGDGYGEYTSLAIYENKLYILGGNKADNSSQGASTDRIYIYDIDTGSIVKATSKLKKSKGRMATVTEGNKVYLLGGRNGNNASPTYLDEVEVINLSEIK